MPTEAGCHVCTWGPETDPEQPFDSNSKAKEAQRKHVHSKDTWRKDVWGENQ